MSSFNVLKSTWLSAKDIQPVMLDTIAKLDSMVNKDESKKNRVFRRDWDLVNSSSERDTEEEEKKTALSIIQEAHHKAQLIEKEAYEKAFALGEKAGREVAERKLRSSMGALKKANEEFCRLKEEIIVRSERELITLCLAIARKVLSQEMIQNKDALVSLVRCGLRCVVDKEQVSIRVNPSDLQHLSQLKSDLGSSEGLRNVAFEEDERIAKGEAVIETRFGTVDCRIDSRMAEIEKHFQDILAEKERK